MDNNKFNILSALSILSSCAGFTSAQDGKSAAACITDYSLAANKGCSAISTFGQCIAESPPNDDYRIKAEDALVSAQRAFPDCELTVTPSFRVVDREVRCNRHVSPTHQVQFPSIPFVLVTKPCTIKRERSDGSRAQCAWVVKQWCGPIVGRTMSSGPSLCMHRPGNGSGRWQRGCSVFYRRCLSLLCTCISRWAPDK